MHSYYINLNKDLNGFNEVHQNTCFYFQLANNKVFLGNFPNAIAAVSYAKTHGYPKADGCYYCSKEAHYR